MKARQESAERDLAEALDRTMARRILVQPQIHPEFVVQHDDGTPTGSRSTSFFIRGILGPDAWSIFMR
jgi:hypothetical protein